MRKRVFVIAGEFSPPPSEIPPERRAHDFLSQYVGAPAPSGSAFFRYPKRSSEWQSKLGSEKLGLVDLLASAGHRTLCTLNDLLQRSPGEYGKTLSHVTHLYVTTMPGLDPLQRINVGLIPQRIRALLDLPYTVESQFVIGTSDSGAWTFAEAVRTARSWPRPVTILVLAGQILPSGYASQYRIRTVLGEYDQDHGLDMLAIGDLLMDIQRRHQTRSRDDIEALLAEVSRRKYKSAQSYPAAIRSGSHWSRQNRITPYFCTTDIAPPCCGAAATLITSDTELLARLQHGSVPQGQSRRYGSPGIVEVLGVGEGSSNPDFLQRASPIVMATSIRQALATAAEDGGVAESIYAASAFAVLHDAFPSIELAFLLSIGLDWESASARMKANWPNPYGGLLTFGHALGASGLVQVNKVFHVFVNDRRYVRRTADARSVEPRYRFPREGAHAFTTSVGGPLSHIVVTLFRGGHAPESPHSPAFSLPRQIPSGSADTWQELRRLLRSCARSYFRRLQKLDADYWLIEGTTTVSIRSCLLALQDADIDRLYFPAIEQLIAGGRHEQIREDLRDAIRGYRALVRGPAAADKPAAVPMQQFLDIFDASIRDQVDKWRADGVLAAMTEEQDENLVAAIKKELNAEVAVVSAVAGESRRESRQKPMRQVIFLPPGSAESPMRRALDGMAFVKARHRDGRLEVYETVPADRGADHLPWWHARARRQGGGPGYSNAEYSTPAELCEALVASDRHLGDESAAENQFLRAFFRSGTPSVALDLAAGAMGISLPGMVAANRRTPILYYCGEPATGTFDNPRECELLARAVAVAQAWLGLYAINKSQVHGSVSLVCLDHRGAGNRDSGDSDQADAGDSLRHAARFARDVALWVQHHGICLRAVVSLGEGICYEDVNGATAAASSITIRARSLMDHTHRVYRDSLSRASSWIVFDLGDIAQPAVAILQEELDGWELLAEDEESQIEYERVSYAIWYR